LDARAETRENVRFVRQAAMDNTAVKPFQGMNLAPLAGLDLACESPATDETPAEGCAVLVEADLNGADLTYAKLSGANMNGANMTNAYLTISLIKISPCRLYTL
jgi:hypothetical protein